MNTGYINQRIEIYATDNIPQESGGTIPGMVLYWSTNATVKQLRTQRTAEANQDPLRMVYSFECRYRKDKSPQVDMYVKWRGQLFSITGISPDVVYNVTMKFDASSIRADNLVTGTNQETT